MKNIIYVMFSFMLSSAFAQDWTLHSKITWVEVTHMPNTLVFRLKTPPPASANCITDADGTWVIYEAYFQPPADSASRQQNVKSAYALVISAKTIDANIIVAGWNRGVKRTDHCTVGQLYLE